MLNVDLKIISKALSEKLKKKITRFNLFTTNLLTNVKSRHTGKNGKLMSDVIEIAKIKKIVFLVAMDIEKTFLIFFQFFNFNCRKI